MPRPRPQALLLPRCRRGLSMLLARSTGANAMRAALFPLPTFHPDPAKPQTMKCRPVLRLHLGVLIKDWALRLHDDGRFIKYEVDRRSLRQSVNGKANVELFNGGVLCSSLSTAFAQHQ